MIYLKFINKMRKQNDERKEQICKKKKDYIPEQNQKASPIEMGNFKRYLKKEDTICKLLTDRRTATGFICQTKMKDKTMKFLFTIFQMNQKLKLVQILN